MLARRCKAAGNKVSFASKHAYAGGELRSNLLFVVVFILCFCFVVAAVAVVVFVVLCCLCFVCCLVVVRVVCCCSVFV